MQGAVLRQVTDDEIEEETPFLLSWGFDNKGLKTSLARVGQVSPLVLQPYKGCLRLICGHRRRLALRDLDRREYSAIILPEKIDSRQALVLALEDNLGHRTFNDAEKALALSLLARYFPPQELIEQYMPRLGLPRRSETLDLFLKLVKLGPECLSALARGDLDPVTGEFLADMTLKDRLAVVSLLERLRPGRNKRRQIVTWLTEIGRREGLTLGGIIRDQRMEEILASDSLSRPKKEKQVRARLRTRRYPHLSRLEKDQKKLINSINLPSFIRLEPPPNFEGLDFSIQITFAGLEELREGAGVLERLLKSPDMAALVEMG